METSKKYGILSAFYQINQKTDAFLQKFHKKGQRIYDPEFLIDSVVKDY